MSKLPKSVAEGVINLGGVSLKTYVLDNGNRVIDVDDAERFFELLGTGELTISEGDALEFARFVHNQPQEPKGGSDE